MATEEGVQVTEQMKGAYVTEKRLRQFGKTKGCPKCEKPESSHAAHSEACRARIDELVKGQKSPRSNASAASQKI